jgi:hypothetical protein
VRLRIEGEAEAGTGTSGVEGLGGAAGKDLCAMMCEELCTRCVSKRVELLRGRGL